MDKETVQLESQYIVRKQQNSATLSLESVPLPVISLQSKYVNENHQSEFLVDTGAQISLISQHSLNGGQVEPIAVDIRSLN